MDWPWLLHLNIFCIVLMLVGVTLALTGYFRQRKDKLVRRRLAQMIDERERRAQQRFDYFNRIVDAQTPEAAADEIIAQINELLEEWGAEREIRARSIAHELGDLGDVHRMVWESQQKVDWKREGF